ncbi:MAG: hypothetical protein PHR96_02445 [Clostridia bacterium]|nr:hypothetical protein [Clostridia bacterium]
MRTAPAISWLGIDGQYSSGNYSGLYYSEIGEYPQSQETNTDIIAGITGEPDGKGYYTSIVNGSKYARKGTGPYTYFLVEPVRWLVIGNGISLNGMGFPNINGNGELNENQLLLISEKVLFKRTYTDYGSNQNWADTQLYNYLNQTIKNLMFSASNLISLGNFESKKLSDPITIYNSTFSILCYSNSNGDAYEQMYHWNTYCSVANVRKSAYTDYCGSVTHYWNRAYLPNINENYTINLSTGSTSEWKYRTNELGVRPLILINV